MDETNERIDLGVWGHDDAREGEQENPLEGQPKGDYRLYAERILYDPFDIEEPLGVRMADYWSGWWEWNSRSDQDRLSRMEALIKFFGLVERSKLPSPPEVPDDVRKAATFVSSNGWGVGSVDTLVQWALEQVGDSEGKRGTCDG